MVVVFNGVENLLVMIVGCLGSEFWMDKEMVFESVNTLSKKNKINICFNHFVELFFVLFGNTLCGSFRIVLDAFLKRVVCDGKNT